MILEYRAVILKLCELEDFLNRWEAKEKKYPKMIKGFDRYTRERIDHDIDTLEKDMISIASNEELQAAIDDLRRLLNKLDGGNNEL